MLRSEDEMAMDDARRGFHEEFGRRVCRWTLDVVSRVLGREAGDLSIYSPRIEEGFPSPMHAEVKLAFASMVRGGDGDYDLDDVEETIVFPADVNDLAKIADRIVGNIYKARRALLDELEEDGPGDDDAKDDPEEAAE